MKLIYICLNISANQLQYFSIPLVKILIFMLTYM